MAEGRLYVGQDGYVVCVDRVRGEIVWSANLRGVHGLVTVATDVEGVFAVGDGELFRLDAATGEIVWHNKLTGFGVGPSTLALQRGDPYDLATGAVAAASVAAASE